MYTDDHRRRHVGRLEVPSPLRDQLTVTREHDCLGRTWRDVHRNLATTVVAERLGNELSRNGRHCCWLPFSGLGGQANCGRREIPASPRSRTRFSETTGPKRAQRPDSVRQPAPNCLTQSGLPRSRRPDSLRQDTTLAMSQMGYIEIKSWRLASYLLAAGQGWLIGHRSLVHPDAQGRPDSG